ncbi:MAG TPA: hypothetical protein VKK19_06230 [Candidatus Dormibacteraeota bacterium]|nr:hypothetical protein [Candidatus Dormibacteraeota bacterium]
MTEELHRSRAELHGLGAELTLATQRLWDYVEENYADRELLVRVQALFEANMAYHRQHSAMWEAARRTARAREVD